MKMFRRRHMMVYFKRILITITVLLVATLIAYSGITYFSVENTVNTIQDDANLKVLSQVNFNIDYTYQMVQDLAYYLYFDSTVKVLLKEKDLSSISQLEYINKVRQLNNITSVTSFVESVIIYNAYDRKYISTGADISLYNRPFIDAIEQYIGKKSSKDAEFTTINYTGEKGKEVNTFSFFLRDWSQAEGEIKSAVIINIKPEWLFTNIKNINKIGQDTESKVYIMDNNRNIYSSYSDAGTVPGVLEEEITEKIIHSEVNTGFFKAKSGGESMFVSYLKNNDTGWCIVDVQPYSALFGKINELRTTFLLITIGILAIAVFLSYYFSRNLYKPVKKMLTHFNAAQEISGGEVNEKDELNYIMKVYDRNKNELLMEKSRSSKNKSYLNQYIIRKLLSDSRSVTEKELADNEGYHSLKIDLNEKLMVIVLKIDDYIQFKSNDGNDRSLYKFVIQNISEEIFSREFPCEMIDLREEHLVLLFNVKGDTERLKSTINSLIAEFQKSIYEYYKISLTAAYSYASSTYHDITDMYNRALYYTNYRLVFGTKSIITPEKTERNESCRNTKLPDELEKKLVQSIKSCDRKQTGILLDNIFSHISVMKYDYIIYSVHRLSLLIKETIGEINSNRIHTIDTDMQDFNESLEKCETLMEIKAGFIDLIHEIFDKLKDIDNYKNDILVDTICGIIEENYQDTNLSLQSIASSIKMSATYVGKVFKSSKKMSVAEYINEIRLNHARDLLQREGYSVNRTFEIVGFVSQSHFFTLFKKKFGCTPKEFRLSKDILNNINNNNQRIY